MKVVFLFCSALVICKDVCDLKSFIFSLFLLYVYSENYFCYCAVLPPLLTFSAHLCNLGGAHFPREQKRLCESPYGENWEALLGTSEFGTKFFFFDCQDLFNQNFLDIVHWIELQFMSTLDNCVFLFCPLIPILNLFIIFFLLSFLPTSFFLEGWKKILRSFQSRLSKPLNYLAFRRNLSWGGDACVRFFSPSAAMGCFTTWCSSHLSLSCTLKQNSLSSLTRCALYFM